MTRRFSAVVLALALFACSKAKTNDHPSGSASTAPPPASDAAAAPPAIDAPTAMEGSGSAAAPDGGSGSAAGSASTDVVDFDKLTHDEKVKFMKTKVMPEMKPAFQKFDAKEYANFGCKTCHGKDPQKTKYKMPNPGLPKLDFAALKAGKQKPEVAKFMADVVKPEMARILQQPEYTEQNPKGFGCLECHEMKK